MKTETMTLHDLVFTRIFNATIETVWKAWSDPEYVKQWWGPNGFTCPMAKIDFREGKTSLLCMKSPEYGDFYSTWRYKIIIPMKQIDYVHNLADLNGHSINPVSIGMPDDFPQEQVHVVTFENLDNNQTKLTITEFGWPAGQMMEMSKIGMEQCLDKMAAIFSKRYYSL